VERKTEKQQQQRVARSGFDVNAGVTHQERANTARQLSLEQIKDTRSSTNDYSPAASSNGGSCNFHEMFGSICPHKTKMSEPQKIGCII
jgi:hypothetical protein